MRSKPKKKKRAPILAIVFAVIIFAAVIALAVMLKKFSAPKDPGIEISGGVTTSRGDVISHDDIDTNGTNVLSEPFEIALDSIKNPVRKAFLSLKWSDIDEDELNQFNGQGYYETFPGVNVSVCTGYVGWAMTHIYGVPDYPHGVSTEAHRNAGEFVDSHRMWLIEHAEYIGSATTVNGVLEYHGGRYKPGDIIIFNNQRDCKEGKLVLGTSTPNIDYWAGEDGTAFFTHVGIVGNNNTKWIENLDTATAEDSGEKLPAGQYNMHHNTWSLAGVVDMLSPEQFITRDVPEDDMEFSRSYEVYRVLQW